MPKTPKPKVPHRSFTVRVPDELYAEIGDMADADGMNVNGKVNQLLRLGLGKHIDLDAAVRRLLKKEATDGED